MKEFKFFRGYVPYFKFYVEGVERMRITSTGVVSIGTNVPSTRLNVQTR
jgi:hypothetical protein